MNSQSSLCKLISGIKLKGAGMPRRRRLIKNPFEIGKSKIWQRHQLRKSKGSKFKHIMMDKSLIPDDTHKENPVSEAVKILDMAEVIGLNNRKEKDQMVGEISIRIEKGII